MVPAWETGYSRNNDTVEDAMLFGEFDWNQVLIAGAVGAGIGLVVWLIKQATGSGKQG